MGDRTHVKVSLTTYILELKGLILFLWSSSRYSILPPGAAAPYLAAAPYVAGAHFAAAPYAAAPYGLGLGYAGVHGLGYRAW